MRGAFLLTGLTLAAAAEPAAAQLPASPVIDTGSTALLIVAGAIGLLGGVVGPLLLAAARMRENNAPGIVGAAACVASLLWIAVGYSLAFGEGSALIGGIENIFLVGLGDTAGALLIPESVFAWSTLALAVLAVSLLVGGLAGRGQAGWALLFASLWLLLVYLPISRWLLAPEGWLGALGAVDFAGGMVVHVTVGVGGYVALARLGRGRHPPEPVSLPLHLGGIAALWIALATIGSSMALAASDLAGSALLNLHLAAAGGALAWAGLARISPRIAAAGGIGGGAIAGLAAAAAGAGYLAPFGAILLGLLAGAMSAFAAGALRRIDDRANMVAIHALSGSIGSLLLVPLAAPIFGGAGFADGKGFAGHMVAQAVALGVVILWSAVMSFIAVRLSAVILPMRPVREPD